MKRYLKSGLGWLRLGHIAVLMSSSCDGGLGATAHLSDNDQLLATAADVQTGQQGMQSISDAASVSPTVTHQILSLNFYQENSIASQGQHIGLSNILYPWIGLCPANTVNITETSKNGNVVLAGNITYANNCNSQTQLSGSEALAATIQISGNYYFTVTELLTRNFANGDTMTMFSLAANTPTFVVMGQGKPTDTNMVYALILNEHRIRQTANNVNILDVNITTPLGVPLQVTDTYSLEEGRPVRRLLNGVINIHHNLAKFNAVVTLNAVLLLPGQGCSCPTSGTMMQVVAADSGKYQYTRNYTFSNCGYAVVTSSGRNADSVVTGSEALQLEDCHI